MSHHQENVFTNVIGGLVGMVFGISHGILSFMIAHPYIEVCFKGLIGGVFGTLGAMFIKTLINQIKLWIRNAKRR